MNAFRQEAAEMLKTVPCRRPAALRRSLLDGWLYATDLPRAAEQDQVDLFQRRAEALGWKTEVRDGWLQMTRRADVPPENGFSGPFGPEAACCLSLLRRHREKSRAELGQTQGDIQAAAVRLVKAGEEGAAAYEKACAALHREWAARLRRKEALPQLDERFFTGDDQ